MPNMASKISSHNKNILNKTSDEVRLCNCNDRNLCPLDGKCLTRTIVYQGEITTHSGNKHKYIGISEPPFKGRSSDHRTSFSNRMYINKTDLSKKVWELKDLGEEPTISFSIIRKTSPYKAGSDHCNLCLWEKFYLMKRKDLLNTRDEMVSKCRHINKFLLQNFKSRNRETVS